MSQASQIPLRWLSRHRIWVVRLTGLALVFSMLVLAGAAVSESLHHWLHADSHESDHHCGVELFADGLVEISNPDAAPALPEIWNFGEIITHQISSGCPSILLPPARGPPVHARPSINAPA